MPSQEEAMINSIIANPDDDTPRLVYADLLEEHGDIDGANFIRVQCVLAAGGWPSGRPITRDEHERLIERERQLRPGQESSPASSISSWTTTTSARKG
jgi:uncharacterized protein (TIGR02996 family)